MKQNTFDGIQAETLGDTGFMSAVEKPQVLTQWEAFLKSGCARERFTQGLYHHLIQHCSFIAHYDIGGFYAIYFERGDDTIHFLSQFDNRKGIPKSVEYGGTWWLGGDYADINTEMCRIASRYIPALKQQARVNQRRADLALARKLLQKHQVKIPEELE